MSDFSEWKKRFKPAPAQRGIEAQPAKCMYPRNEGPHKVACLATAVATSPDKCPVCEQHTNVKIRPLWRGFVEGA